MGEGGRGQGLSRDGAEGRRRLSSLVLKLDRVSSRKGQNLIQ